MDRDTGADNGFLDIDRTEDDDGYTVSATTAEGRISTFRVEEDAAGNTTRINTDPSGLVTTTIELANSNEVETASDGTQTTETKLPDHRFGMLAPLSSLKVQTPGGLAYNITPIQDPALQLFDAQGSLTRQIDDLNINGRVFRSQYNKIDPALFPTGFVTNIFTPEGRRIQSFVDDQLRVVDRRITGFFNTVFTYDTRGRLISVVQRRRHTRCRSYQFYRLQRKRVHRQYYRCC